jgi:hypothetical protein
MVFMVVVSVLLAGFVWRRERARQQVEAANVIVSNGGTVGYDFEVVHDPLFHFRLDRAAGGADQSGIPRWWRNRLGTSFFHDVSVVWYDVYPRKNQKISEDVWTAISRFDRLAWFEVRNCEIDGTTLANRLTSGSELKLLRLDNCGIQDPDLEQIVAFDNLEALHLHQNPVTDRGVGELTRLQELRQIGLGSTQVTDEGVKLLTELSSLAFVSICDSRISDRGLSELCKIRNLESLFLSGTQVSDDGLLLLVNCPHLRRLDVRATKVTFHGVNKFHLVRPDVHIYGFDPSAGSAQ